MEILRVALAQINPVVGELRGNANKIIQFIKKARALNTDIVVFPELSLCGYPPEDLLLKPHFIKENRKYLNRIIKMTKGIFSIVGFPYYYKDALFNAAALIYDKRLLGVYKKMFLPNYGVFDEMRYFKAGDSYPVIKLARNLKIGVNICEDIWRKGGPGRFQSLTGKAKIIINISASPYHVQKINFRQKMLSRRAKENNVFIFYCNLVGGQDELVFDGASMAYGPNGNLIARAKQFQEDLLIIDLEVDNLRKGNDKEKFSVKASGSKVKKITLPFVLNDKKGLLANKIEKCLKPQEETYSALCLGLRDYVKKSGFKKIVLGLSGGIDSSLVACLAVDALGKENVVALSMPSMYSSRNTQLDASRLSKNLGIKLYIIPISNIYKSYLKTLHFPFKNKKRDVTEENIQARIRGNLLMAFSNKFGWLVVTTGNKSELSVGYCTLYGDTVGGFALIKDVPKMLVYELARFRNLKSGKEIIPESVFKRAPSAELKKGQKDQDTLPAYSRLDKIIDAYIEKDKGKNKIIASGFNERMVKKVISMIDRNEYKRRQSPIGVKITPKAFGKDRRMPIINKFYG